MKKKMIFALLLAGMSFAIVKKTDAKEREQGSCFAKIVDCPGLFTGDKVVCVTDGNGPQCTCGQSGPCE